MKEIFSETFNNVVFEFTRLVFDTHEVWYKIDFNNNGNKDSFKMYKDDEGIWKIAASQLPEWIKETEQEFYEAIINNEHS
jgi:hypothetical protein